MPVLSIAHITTYAYRQPVSFGEHRLMVRPRESYDQQLLGARIDIDPTPAELRWLHDVFGNAVAVACFEGTATHRSNCPNHRRTGSRHRTGWE